MMTYNEAAKINDAAMFLHRPFRVMSLKAFNAIQHYYTDNPIYPNPSQARLDAAQAELRLIWRMLPRWYRENYEDLG